MVRVTNAAMPSTDNKEMASRLAMQASPRLVTPNVLGGGTSAGTVCLPQVSFQGAGQCSNSPSGPSAMVGD